MPIQTKLNVTFIFVLALAMLVGCTRSEQPGKTKDGVMQSGSSQSVWWFDRNSQISEQVSSGELRDEVSVDEPSKSSTTDHMDLSGTTARDNHHWGTDRLGNSAVGYAREPGSNNASKAALHAADGSSPVVASGNSLNSVTVDGDRKARVSKSKKVGAGSNSMVNLDSDGNRAPASVGDDEHSPESDQQ